MPEASIKVIFQDRVLETVRISKDEFTVGRLADNDIVIPNLGVSRHHCRFVREGDDYIAEDLESANGIYINGVRLNRSKLYSGDEIVVGKHKLVFELSDAQVASSGSGAAKVQDVWSGDRTMFTAAPPPAQPKPVTPPPQPIPLKPEPQPEQPPEKSIDEMKKELEGKDFGLKIIFDGKVVGLRAVENREITVGRDPTNDIVIDNLSVSNRHMHIIFYDDQHIAEDLNSANGTRVNGVAVKKTPLYPGDRILVGKHTLVFDRAAKLAVTLLPEEIAAPPVQAPEPAPGPQQAEPEKELGPWEGKFVVRVRMDDKDIFTHTIKKRVTCIGRLAENDIAIDNIGVSRLHAKIYVEENEQCYVEDENSSNGISVNGLPMKRSPLYPGDQIQIVKHKLIFDLALKSQDPPAAEAGAKLSADPWRLDATYTVENTFEQAQRVKEWAGRAAKIKEERGKQVRPTEPEAQAAKPPVEEKAPAPPPATPPPPEPAAPEVEAPAETTTPPAQEQAEPPKKPKSEMEDTFIFPTVKITLSDGKDIFIERDELIIGNADNAGLRLSGAWIKPVHAIIKRELYGKWSITCFGLLKKVKVNGQTVKTAELNDGDRIDIGNRSFKFIKIKR